jgi:signal transduction histidine kinase
VPLRLRVFFRGAFLLLALATIALAVAELSEEKQQSYRAYRDLFERNVEQISARLQHPSGQLALLNPALPGATLTPLRPLLLPFSAIDFDDKAKAQQAAEMAGCLVQYPHHAQLCVSVGNNPVAGGFIYVVGTFASRELVTHAVGDLDLSHAHRLRVQVSMRGHAYEWLAPLEAVSGPGRPGAGGRLTGFVLDRPGHYGGKPDRDFRGWLWQDGRCLEDAAASAEEECGKRSFFSVRLPIDLFREELLDSPKIVWPPKDLAEIQVRVQALAPGDGPPLFDSNEPGASAPFALSDLRSQLLEGETLRIVKLGTGTGHDVLMLSGHDTRAVPQSPWLLRLVQRLRVPGFDRSLSERRTITTPLGDYEIELDADMSGVDRDIGLAAGRLFWFVAAILVAILITWMGIEWRIIRRITLLTKRAASVKRSVGGREDLQIDLKDLRGGDELGLLAGVLADLLQRVNEDTRREQIRIEQEQDMWRAIGHEIMAPLQSLAALHAAPDDASQRYIQRMRRAVRVLYGSASPSEAILSAPLQVQTLDIGAFLRTVAGNASHAGIAEVIYDGPEAAVIVKADESSLEDVLTHILTNADRYRAPGTPIRMSLRCDHTSAEVRIHNQGPPIDAALIGKIFEYGVSESSGESGNHRGQGLFVARTYMAKMGGTVEAVNRDDGVDLVLKLALATPTA